VFSETSFPDHVHLFPKFLSPSYWDHTSSLTGALSSTRAKNQMRGKRCNWGAKCII